jgi:sterol desaturase/sphingolipid hydroxylase (fatty acid hydroxylase superfamily)
MMARVLPYLWYPLFLSGAMVAFGAMLAADHSPSWAAYAPIMVVAFAIVALEQWFPERREWRPDWSDVKADAAFMGVVQVALPRALVAFGVVELSGWMYENAPSSLWPHHWPLAAQVVAMVIAVDFMRYWLHRACHRFIPLWRLHEVHHSPDILYTLNVGRFHPFEKTLHFCFDTVPFVLVGVSPEVIAGYFLLYSVNGFFQHSNLRLRYGWLNYVVGSAETHRWHHARDPKTASCNFGNTTIIWDLLFGTWYLPKKAPVDAIGIMDRTYPKGFWAQMFTPFRRRDGTPWRAPHTLLADALIWIKLWWMRLVQGRRIAAAAKDPMRVQRALLARIVAENAQTDFGRAHGFAEIGSYEDFARRVPVGEYETLRPFVESEIARGEKALTCEPPEWYVRTSGTTGKPKDVPLTRSHLRALRRIQQTSVAYQHRACPEAFSGGIMAIVSPAYEGVLANGKPFGSASGIVASNTPAAVMEKFVVPAPVLTISDSLVKYLLILRLALARPDISYLGAANPTTMLTLIKLYREHQSALMEDLRRGTFFLAARTPPEILHAIAGRLLPRPERAAQLARLQAGAVPRIADLWPALRLVVTWTCASAGVAVRALRSELSPRTRILELGYLSTEFRGTITLGKRAGSGFPTLDAHFFEFVERDKWDRGEPEFLTLERLRKGADYYVVVTTPSGLYRYFINDLVRVMGFLHRTPLLKFVQKGKGVTNVTGEKVYEAQVLSAVGAAMAGFGRAARFVMALADEEECRYRLYVEAEPGPKPPAARLGEAVDTKLKDLNIEYAGKRESARLGPPLAAWLAPETGEAYKQYCVKQGQREGQFKMVALAYRKGFGFDLNAFTEAPR